MQNRLVASLYRESLFEDLLYEDESLTAERNRVKSLLQAYREAFQVRPLRESSIERQERKLTRRRRADAE